MAALLPQRWITPVAGAFVLIRSMKMALQWHPAFKGRLYQICSSRIGYYGYGRMQPIQQNMAYAKAVAYQRSMNDPVASWIP
jgi:hypothetical protein